MKLSGIRRHLATTEAVNFRLPTGAYGKDFQLVPKHSACLASDACGIPSLKQKRQLSELVTANESKYTPGGGCC